MGNPNSNQPNKSNKPNVQQFDIFIGGPLSGRIFAYQPWELIFDTSLNHPKYDQGVICIGMTDLHLWLDKNLNSKERVELIDEILKSAINAIKIQAEVQAEVQVETETNPNQFNSN